MKTELPDYQEKIVFDRFAITQFTINKNYPTD